MIKREDIHIEEDITAGGDNIYCLVHCFKGVKNFIGFAVIQIGQDCWISEEIPGAIFDNKDQAFEAVINLALLSINNGPVY